MRRSSVMDLTGIAVTAFLSGEKVERNALTFCTVSYGPPVNYLFLKSKVRFSCKMILNDQIRQNCQNKAVINVRINQYQISETTLLRKVSHTTLYDQIFNRPLEHNDTKGKTFRYFKQDIFDVLRRVFENERYQN